MNLYTAIIVGQQCGRQFGAKYRNVNNLEKFMQYVRQTWAPRGATAVNFYDKKTKQFFTQKKVEQ